MSKLETIIESIIEEEIANIGQAALFKEKIMQMVQKAIAVHKDSVSNQSDFNSVIDSEIDTVKAEMDVTFDMVARTLKGIPFEVFYSALDQQQKDKGTL